MSAAALHKQALPDVAVTSIARRPRAIVIVFGWLHAKPHDVHEYTALYHSLHCSTISCTAPAVDNNQALQQEWAVAVVKEAARLVRMAQLTDMSAPPIPILLHVFHGAHRLVNQLQRCLCEQVDKTRVSNPLSSPKTPVRKWNSSSTRSLFTNSTDPLSDDESDSSEPPPNSSEISLMSSELSLDASPTLTRRRKPTTTTTTASPPSVHRIDMERTGLSFQSHPDDNDRARQRDLQLVHSHVTLMLWDTGNPGWAHRVYVAIVMALVVLWQWTRQWLWGCDSHCSTDIVKSEDDPLLDAMFLTQKHAIVYQEERHFQRIYARANDTMNVSRCLLEGATNAHFGKRHLRDDYVAFVTNMVDSIATNATQTQDGWSSDEE